LAVLLTGIGTVVPIVVKNWTPIIAVPYSVIIVVLVLMIWFVVKGIQAIDAKDNEEDKERKAELNAIMKKLGITQEEIAESKREITNKQTKINKNK